MAQPLGRRLKSRLIGLRPAVHLRGRDDMPRPRRWTIGGRAHQATCSGIRANRTVHAGGRSAGTPTGTHTQRVPGAATSVAGQSFAKTCVTPSMVIKLDVMSKLYYTAVVSKPSQPAKQ